MIVTFEKLFFKFVYTSNENTSALGFQNTAVEKFRKKETTCGSISIALNSKILN